MKKIFFALSLMLAFTINANAQENKSNAQENAKKESLELAQVKRFKSAEGQMI